MVELVKLGIDGLDAMLFGGLPAGNQVMVGGGPGAGKTLLAFEFIYKSAKAGEKGVFFALEEDPKRVVRNAKMAFPKFTDIDELVESGRLRIEGGNLLRDVYDKYEQTGLEFGKVVSEMESIVVESKATRAVVDSTSALELVIKDPVVYRKSMWSLTANFSRLGVTTIYTSEMHSPDRSKLVFRQEHFIFDGMILMYQSGEESRRIHALEIIKMRGSMHSFVTAPYEITSNGFQIFSPELITKR